MRYSTIRFWRYFPYDQEAYYACFKGYSLQGKHQVRHCRNSKFVTKGFWSGIAPECRCKYACLKGILSHARIRSRSKAICLGACRYISHILRAHYIFFHTRSVKCLPIFVTYFTPTLHACIESCSLINNLFHLSLPNIELIGS